MKRVLILTVTAGNAHNACANVMKRRLESIGGCEVKIINIMDSFSDKVKAWISTDGYLFAVGKFPGVYNAFFNKYAKRSPSRRYTVPSQETVLSMTEGLLKEIIDFKPDVIYSTQFYGSMLITDLKLIYSLPFKSITSTLDYYIAPFWESGIGVDYFTIANDEFISDCIFKGYTREQILPWGIPVDERTLEITDKRAAKRSLGLDDDVFTAMVIFGGGYWDGGFKIFKDLVKALKGRKAQIIMINGKNKKSYKKVASMKLPEGIKVLNVGFTSDVPLYLSAADVILDKAGGSSVTEIINKGVPMLVTEKLVMQEKHNLEYLKEKGVAMSFKDARTLKEKILRLYDNPDLRKEMAERTAPLKKNAVGELAKFILNQPAADYTEILKENIDFTKVRKQVKTALKKADRHEKANRRN